MFQWKLTVCTWNQAEGWWDHEVSLYFATKAEAVKARLRGLPGYRMVLRQDHEVTVPADVFGVETMLSIGRLDVPFGTCPVCGATGLWRPEDTHRTTSTGCTSLREPLTGRLVHVATIDGAHRGYGRIAKRDGYSVLWVQLFGGPMVPVGDEEYQLMLPGFEALGITCHRVGESWADYPANR